MEADGSTSVQSSFSHNEFDSRNFVRALSPVDNRLRKLRIRESVSSLNGLLDLRNSPRSSSNLSNFSVSGHPYDNDNNFSSSSLSREMLQEEKSPVKKRISPTLIRNPRYEKIKPENEKLSLDQSSQNARLKQTDSVRRSTSQIMHDSQVAMRRKHSRKYVKKSRRTSLPTHLTTNRQLLSYLLDQRSPDFLARQQLAKHDDLEIYLDDIAAQIHRQAGNQMSTKEKELFQSLASKEDRFTILESRLVKSVIYERFPKWDYGRIIGSGANGIIEVAIHPDTEEPLFAIKKTSGYRMTDGLHEKQVYKAAIKMLTLFDHPNILQYYGGEIVDDTFITYLEYCNEGSLTNKIYDGFANGEAEKPGITNEFLIRQYTRDIVKGLDYFHRHDVVHRDIKPGNIMIHDGVAKLGDMGAMRIQNRCCNKSHGVNIMGSPSYLAPETVTGNRNLGAIGAEDIWALGCCIFEMILGQAPWIAIDNVWSLYFMIGTWMTRALAAHEIFVKENPDDKEHKIPSNVPKYRGKNYNHQQKILSKGRKDKHKRQFSNSSSLYSVGGNYDSIEHFILHPKNSSQVRQTEFYLQKKRQQENQLQQIQQYHQENSFQNPGHLRIESQYSSASSTPSIHTPADTEYPFSNVDGLSRPINSSGSLTRSHSIAETVPKDDKLGNTSRSNSWKGRWWKSEDDETIDGESKFKQDSRKRSGSRSKSRRSDKSDKSDHESDQNILSFLRKSKSKNSLRSKSPSHSLSSKNSSSNLEDDGLGKFSSLFGRRRALTIGHGPSNNSKNQNYIPPVPPIPEKFASLAPVSPSVGTQFFKSFIASTNSMSRPNPDDDARSITSTIGTNYSSSNATLYYSDNDFSREDEKKKGKKTRSLRSLSRTRNETVDSLNFQQREIVTQKSFSSLYRRKEEKDSEASISTGAAVPLSSSPSDIGRKPTLNVPIGNTLVDRRELSMPPLVIDSQQNFEDVTPILSSPSIRGRKLTRQPPKVHSSVGKLSSHPIFSYITKLLAQLTSNSGTNMNDSFSQTIEVEEKSIPSEGFKQSRKSSLNRLKNMIGSTSFHSSELPPPIIYNSVSSLPLPLTTSNTQEDLLKDSRKQYRHRMPVTSLLSQNPSYDQARVVKWMADAMKLPDPKTSNITEVEEESEYGDHFDLDDYYTESPQNPESRLSHRSIGNSIHSSQFDEIDVVESYQDVDDADSTIMSGRNSMRHTGNVRNKSSPMNIQRRTESGFDSSESVEDLSEMKRFSWAPECFKVKEEIDNEIRGVESKSFPNILISDEMPPLNHSDSDSGEDEPEKTPTIESHMQLIDSRKDEGSSTNSKNLWAIGNLYYEKTSLNHPLVDMAKESGKFSDEALDFMYVFHV
ncbi:Suppressor of Sensor Kinase (SLN1) [Nowakowskiella sp. JEL0078]|nr:Suppressor of Sensor Kinase (SLN1) [Nowakowskiella sp. JEL0078]